MPTSCVAYGCTNRFKKESDVSFHRFPVKEELCKRWTVNMRRKDWKPTQHHYVCSQHFTEDDFEAGERARRRLKRNSVPSIFNFPPHLQKVKKSRPVRVREEVTAHESSTSNDLPSTSQSTPSSDHTYCSPSSPTKWKRKYDELDSRYTTMLDEKRKQISSMKSKLFRKTKEINSLNEMLVCLRNEGLITACNEELIKDNFPDILRSIIKKTNNGKYDESIRSFALTLNFYSPRAYQYVRECFGFNLPHPETLRRWNKAVEGLPGFTAEALGAIQCKVNEKEGITYACLMFDEMAIRKMVEWDGNQFVGYVDMGLGLNGESMAMAKEVLLLMVVALNASWKVPIGYFLTDGMAACEKANLVSEALKMLHDLGVKVVSLTFDGTATNFNVAKLLGAIFNVPNQKPWFPHPCNEKEDVCVILDPCHMLKLIRNLLGDKKLLTDVEGNKINWEYIVELHRLQEKEGLRLANKLRGNHIFWYNQKMKVKLAAQVLSSSVGDALMVLEHDLNYTRFTGSEPTAKFCYLFDRLFDIMNSKNPLAKGNKSVMRLSNMSCWKTFFESASLYLINLCDSTGRKVIETNRKTAVLGFLCNIKSFFKLFEQLVHQGDMQYLSTYKMSQDHLETFFSLVRARGGWNNNPSCTQFRSAYRKLLIQNSIKVNSSGNCIPQDATTVLCTQLGSYDTSDTLLVSNSRLQDISTTEDSLSFFNFLPDIYLSDVSAEIVVYISGFVARSVIKKLKCPVCCYACEAQDGIVSNCSLLLQKQRGGLIVPSPEVVKICNTSEKILRSFLARYEDKPPPIKKLGLIVQILVLESVGNVAFPSLAAHMLETEFPENHIFKLSKMIIQEYVKVRMHHIGRVHSSRQQGMNVRNKLTKAILFQNQ